jgi:hypothetical protein
MINSLEVSPKVKYSSHSWGIELVINSKLLSDWKFYLNYGTPESIRL